MNVISLLVKTASADANTLSETSGGLSDLLGVLTNFIQKLIPFIIGLTVLFFLWGIFKLVFSAKDSDARSEARGYIIWGLIGLAVMVSVWGLVNILTSTLQLKNDVQSGPGIPLAS